jgi:hypothetical protein
MAFPEDTVLVVVIADEILLDVPILTYGEPEGQAYKEC